MIRAVSIMVSLFLLLQVCGPTVAQDSMNVRMLGEVHGFVQQAHDVAMAGNFAYVASGSASGLRILDLSDPTLPVEAAYAINNDACTGVETWSADKVRVLGDYAYVLYYSGVWAGTNYRLYIYDVSNPSVPSQLGYICLPDLCTDLFIEGNYVYVAVCNFNFNGIKIIDVSNPVQPFEAGSFQTTGMLQSIYVTDNTAYIAVNSALLIYDVTDPGSPAQLGRYAPEVGTALIQHVAVQGKYVCIADAELGLRILDVSDFSRITEVASIPHNKPDVYYSHIMISDDLIYFMQNNDTSSNMLVIVDISVPALPYEVGSYIVSSISSFTGFDYKNGYACIAAVSSGVIVLDVSNTSSIKEVGSYRPHATAFGLSVTGGYAFISVSADSENLLVYDIQNPSSPTEVHSISIGGRPFWISVYGNFLYIPGMEVDLNAGVCVMDISDPTNLTEIAFWQLPHEYSGVPLNVELYNNYAFVATGYGGVQIYDVSRIDQPVALGSWTLFDPITNPAFGVRNVKVSWPYLFVPDEASGLHVLDVSDPTDIVEVASHPSSGSAWWVDISHNAAFVYLADMSGGLRILDVSNPLAPREIGSYTENIERATHVTVCGDSVYLSDSGQFGLHVIDVSDPAAPVEVVYHSTPGAHAQGITVANNLVYVIEKTHFEIFEIYGQSTGTEDIDAAPALLDYRINSVYPNPFNMTTKIVFELAKTGHATLEIFNSVGQKVQTLLDGYCQAGRHTYIFRANELSSGFYMLRLKVNGVVDAHRLILMK